MILFPRRRTTMWIHPPSTVMMTCSPTIRSYRFGTSIHEKSLRRSTPFARCALALRGIQHASLADCALLLDVSRGIVAGAYFHALRWNGEQ